MDTLDVAYIAIGARQALLELGNHAHCDHLDGELGFIGACIRQADLLDRIWREVGGELSCEWCYEVAEPFGLAYGRHLLQCGNPKEAENILRSIVAGCIDERTR